MKQIFYLFTVVILFFAYTTASSSTPTCVDVNGDPVDWFVLFLFPETANKTYSLSYGYYDSNSKDLKYYNYSNTSFPPLKVVLKTVEGNTTPKSTNYFIWNDDLTCEDGDDKCASPGKAHSKGTLLYNSNKGVFISHSLPRFPAHTEEGELLNHLPNNSGINGQSFICLSVNKENSIKVVETLNIINPPIIFMNGNEDNVDKNNEAVMKLIKNRYDDKLPKQQITQIKTEKGDKFIIFSKSKNSTDLPYDKNIPEYYEDGFYVETWTRPDAIESNCSTVHKIKNVEKVKFKDFEFDQNQEHSKWGVAIKKDICCFGDLNRTFTQKKRGGNVICFENKRLANIMRSSILKYEECKGGKIFLEYLD